LIAHWILIRKAIPMKLLKAKVLSDVALVFPKIRYKRLWTRRSQGMVLIVFLMIQLDVGMAFEGFSILKIVSECWR
jgi:hypothetical protein